MALALAQEKTAYEGPVDSPIRRARLDTLLEELRTWGRQLGHTPVDGSLAKSSLPTVTFFMKDGRGPVAFVPSRMNELNVSGQVTISANGKLLSLCDLSPLDAAAKPDWELFMPGNADCKKWTQGEFKVLLDSAVNA